MASNGALGRLNIALGLDTAEFTNGLTKAERQAKGSLDLIARQAQMAAIALAGLTTVVAGGLFVAMKRTADQMVNLNTMAKQVGMSAEAFTSYAAAARDANISTEDFQSGVTKLAKSMADPNSRGFAALGIDPTKLKTTKEALDAIADAFAKTADGPGKVAAAQDILGRSGAKLIPLLDQGSAAIQKQIGHLKDLGVVMDEEGSKRVQAYDDAMDEWQGTIDGLTQKLTVELLPTFVDLTKNATDFVQGLDTKPILAFANAAAELVKNLDGIAVFFGTRFAVKIAITEFVAITTAMQGATVAAGLLKTALSVMGGPLGIVASGIGLAAVGIYEFSQRTPPAETAAKELKTALDQLADSSGKAAGKARDHATALREQALAQLDAATAALVANRQEVEAMQAQVEQQRALAKANTAPNGLSLDQRADVAVGSQAVIAGQSLDRLRKQFDDLVKLREQIDRPLLSADDKSKPKDKPPVNFSPAGSDKEKKPKKDTDPIGELSQKALNDAEKRYKDFIDQITGRSDQFRVETQTQWLNDARKAGDVNAHEYAIAMGKINKVTQDTQNDMDQFAIQAARNIQDSLGDGLYNILSGNFDDIGKSWADMLFKMIAQAEAAQLSKSLFGDFGSNGKLGGSLGGLLQSAFSAFGGNSLSDGTRAGILAEFGYAKGGVPPGGLSAFSGGIYDTPHVFKFARGAGVFGEAGPEAIMPLARGSDGKLGVKSAGGGAPNVAINITNNGEPVQAKPQGAPTWNGEEWVINVVLDKARRSGQFRSSMRNMLAGA